jgi:hypothetical protein
MFYYVSCCYCYGYTTTATTTILLLLVLSCWNVGLSPTFNPHFVSQS